MTTRDHSARPVSKVAPNLSVNDKPNCTPTVKRPTQTEITKAFLEKEFPGEGRKPSVIGGKWQEVAPAPSSPDEAAANVNPSLPGAVGVDTVNARVPNPVKALAREDGFDDETGDDTNTPDLVVS